MGGSWKWLYHTVGYDAGERFALSHTSNRKKAGRSLNFWHILPGQVFLYTFNPNSKYNKGVVWSKRLCRELLQDLRSPKPSVDVLRFAVNGTYIFKAEGNITDQVPKEPAEDLWQVGRISERHPQIYEAKCKRVYIEEMAGQKPAPYILYGKHDHHEKEYSWKLTPDKPKRQGIVPGDRVLVWTRHGFTDVVVTRIEPSDGTELQQPEARVKKKLAADERVWSRTEQWLGKNPYRDD